VRENKQSTGPVTHMLLRNNLTLVVLRSWFNSKFSMKLLNNLIFLLTKILYIIADISRVVIMPTDALVVNVDRCINPLLTTPF